MRAVRREVLDPDPERLIYEWHEHYPVPIWVSSESRSACAHCEDHLTLGKRHHCRLCGERFCALCTALFYVKPEFNIKGRSQGATRVCFGCVNECTDKRREAMEGALYDPVFERRNYFVSTVSDGIRHIHPPRTYVISESPSCAICFSPLSKSKCKHCRVCGEHICRHCSTPLEIPKVYHSANAKHGKDTVCNECRYMIVDGAQLESVALPPNSKSSYTFEPRIKLSDSAHRLEPCVESLKDAEELYHSDDNDLRSFESGNDYHASPLSYTGIAPTGIYSAGLFESTSGKFKFDSTAEMRLTDEDLMVKIAKGATILRRVHAIADYSSESSGMLEFHTGEALDIIKFGREWWLAVRKNSEVGWIPPKCLHSFLLRKPAMSSPDSRNRLKRCLTQEMASLEKKVTALFTDISLFQINGGDESNPETRLRICSNLDDVSNSCDQITAALMNYQELIQDDKRHLAVKRDSTDSDNAIKDGDLASFLELRATLTHLECALLG